MGSCFKYLTTLAVLNFIRKASLGRNKYVVGNSPFISKSHVQCSVYRRSSIVQRDLTHVFMWRPWPHNAVSRILRVPLLLFHRWPMWWIISESENSLTENPANVGGTLRLKPVKCPAEVTVAVFVSVCVGTRCWERKQLKKSVIFCCPPECYLWCVVVKQLFWIQL